MNSCGDCTDSQTPATILVRSRILRLRSLIAALAVGLGAMGCASGGPPPDGLALVTNMSSPGATPLEPGDAIQVSFSRESDQSGQYEIDEAGRVSLPFLNVWNVRGMAPDSLRTTLLTAYHAQLRNQTIEVRLLRRVRVLGEVQKPGLYLVDGTMTLADLVAKAGGATGNGNLEHVRVYRGAKRTQADLRTGASAFKELHSGDQVYIPEKSWLSRHSATVIGAVISAAAGLVVVLTH